MTEIKAVEAWTQIRAGELYVTEREPFAVECYQRCVVIPGTLAVEQAREAVIEAAREFDRQEMPDSTEALMEFVQWCEQPGCQRRLASTVYRRAKARLAVRALDGEGSDAP